MERRGGGSRARIEIIKHNEFIRDKNTETFSGHLRNKAGILKQIRFVFMPKNYCTVARAKNTIKFHSPGVSFIMPRESTFAKTPDTV